MKSNSDFQKRIEIICTPRKPVITIWRREKDQISTQSRQHIPAEVQTVNILLPRYRKLKIDDKKSSDILLRINPSFQVGKGELSGISTIIIYPYHSASIDFYNLLLYRLLSNHQKQSVFRLIDNPPQGLIPLFIPLMHFQSTPVL